jgi:outer membrane lipoprotein-sorting protein
VFVLCAAALPSSAQEDGDAADVARVEAWIEGVETLAARFVQVAPDGAITEGAFYLRRPGRLRFDYDPPTPLLIVADGFRISLYDEELDQANSWLIAATPLAPLLRRDLDLAGDFVSVVLRHPGLLRVTLIDRDKPDDGSLTLVFQESPFELQQWVVIDAAGQTTVVGLTELAVDIPLDPRLFRFDDPRMRTPE